MSVQFCFSLVHLVFGACVAAGLFDATYCLLYSKVQEIKTYYMDLAPQSGKNKIPYNDSKSTLQLIQCVR